jgi:hypothetical protein
LPIEERLDDDERSVVFIGAFCAELAQKFNELFGYINKIYDFVVILFFLLRIAMKYDSEAKSFFSAVSTHSGGP